MRFRRFPWILTLWAICTALSLQAGAQSAGDIAVLKGLAPVSVLSNTDAGKAALKANYVVTGGIQTGAVTQPTLLPFAEQQQQALRDVFVTGGNLAQLADGLGTTLGAAYVARAHYIDPRHFTNVTEAVADVIAYAISTSTAHSAGAKYFFANETTDGKTPASTEAIAILKTMRGFPDIFGKAYGLPTGTAGADIYGNSRPFQTEPSVTRIVGLDYFSDPTDNMGNSGGLVNSPSYPSGHTTYGYTGAIVLAVLVPQRYQQLMVRAAEFGNDRIIVGAHYAMDVLGGRALALYDMAHLLANDPAYMGRSIRNAPAITDFREAVKKARADITQALQAGCGNTIDVCAGEDIGRMHNPEADAAFYAATQTYDLPVVYSKNVGLENVGKLAPEAGYLLTVAFPSLKLDEADEILTETEGPGGGFLDDGSSFGVYSRLNLYVAAVRASNGTQK